MQQYGMVCSSSLFMWVNGITCRSMLLYHLSYIQYVHSVDGMMTMIIVHDNRRESIVDDVRSFVRPNTYLIIGWLLDNKVQICRSST